MFTKILVPVDLQGASLAGVELAVKLAEENGASLVFQHVIDPATIPSSEGDDLPGATRAEQQAHTAVVDLVSQVGTELPHDIEITFGAASEEVARLAGLSGADLVVITTKNHSKVAKMVLGSQAQDIILSTQVPVLCVPKH